MSNKGRFIFGALLLLWMSSFCNAADIISAEPEKVALTIYRENISSYDELVPLTSPDVADTGLVMVSETRQIELPAGESRIEFRGVAEGVIPQTAKLQNLTGTIVESNFDYDLLTPYDLLRKSVGESVVFVRTNPQTGQQSEQAAVIRSSEAGVVLDINGHLEEFVCDGDPQHIIFNRLPPGLAAQPTLSIVVRTQTAAKVTLQLNYLALGVQWRADYVASIREDRKTLDLSAWITLVNGRGTSFVNAPIQVVAGTLERNEDETVPPVLQRPRAGSSCWPQIALPRYDRYTMYEVEEVVVTGLRTSVGIKATQSEIGDYKLYLLPEATTLAAKQSKQVLMLAQENVSFKRAYHYAFDVHDLASGLADAENTEEPAVFNPALNLRFKNTKANNLGIPLPAGNVTVFDSENNLSLLVGENFMTDQLKQADVAIELQRDMDITITPTIATIEQIIKPKKKKYKLKEKYEYGEEDEYAGADSDEGEEETTSEYRQVDFLVENFKSTPVIVELEQIHSEYYEATIFSESIKSHLKNGSRVWTLKLNAGEKRHLKYKVAINTY